ncbi:DUF2142 domain-containing protein [Arthrobacter sp. BE255]|uniref:DUF2142 domain-containing protein n=1 Tax=Arthrobacter sp. BE255 TaxID=2817721 RepID=UPI0037BEE94A
MAYLGSFDCFARQADVTPACVKPFTGNRDELVETRTSAGNYNPVYYAVAGLPSLFSSDPGVVYAMRLVSSLLSCFFLALTFAALSQMRQRKWAMVATAVAVTPMVLVLNGVVNLNSLDYPTVAALLADLASLLERSLEPADCPRFVPIIAASGCLLANERPVAAVACLGGGRGLHSWERDAVERFSRKPVGLRRSRHNRVVVCPGPLMVADP